MKLEIHMLAWNYFQQKSFLMYICNQDLRTVPQSLPRLYIVQGYTMDMVGKDFFYPVLGDILLELLAKIFNLNW